MVRRLEVELYLRDGGGRIPLLVSKRSADVSALRSSELGKRGEEGYREKWALRHVTVDMAMSAKSIHLLRTKQTVLTSASSDAFW